VAAAPSSPARQDDDAGPMKSDHGEKRRSRRAYGLLHLGKERAHQAEAREGQERSALGYFD